MELLSAIFIIGARPRLAVEGSAVLFSFERLIGTKYWLRMSPEQMDLNNLATSGYSQALLLQVPAEVRLLILEHVVRSECDHQTKNLYLVQSQQPSITLVNRLIREEALPIWYSMARFPIRFRARPSYDMWQTGTANYEMQLKLPASTYPRMRKIELCFEQSFTMSALYYCFSVDMNLRNNSYTIEHTPKTANWWTGHRPWSIEVHKKAERRLNRLKLCFDVAVAEMIAASGGVQHLKAESFQRLVPQSSWQFGEDV